MDIFWEQLRKVFLAELNERGISKAEYARRLGWPAPHVNRYLGSEEGTSNEEMREPKLDKLMEMAKGLDKPLAELIQKATGEGTLKVIPGAQGRNAMIGEIACRLCDMSLEELQTVSNTVRLLKEKQAAKKSAGKKSQAG